MVNGNDIPKPVTITVFFPRSLKMSTEKILRLIEVQNSNLNTGAWKVLNSKKERTLISFAIDRQSEKALKAEGCAMNFRFRRIPVSGLEIEGDPAEVSKDMEMPSTSRKSGKQEGRDGLSWVHPLASVGSVAVVFGGLTQDQQSTCSNSGENTSLVELEEKPEGEKCRDWKSQLVHS